MTGNRIQPVIWTAGWHQNFAACCLACAMRNERGSIYPQPASRPTFVNFPKINFVVPFQIITPTKMASNGVDGMGDRQVDINGNEVGRHVYEEGERDPDTVILVSLAPYGEQVGMNLVRPFFSFGIVTNIHY